MLKVEVGMIGLNYNYNSRFGIERSPRSYPWGFRCLLDYKPVYQPEIRAVPVYHDKAEAVYRCGLSIRFVIADKKNFRGADAMRREPAHDARKALRRFLPPMRTEH